MPTAVVALGMAVVIGTKGIDLSVGSVIAIVGAVITWRIHAGDPHGLILLSALGVGLLCGLWNGFLVAILDIQPIIATLILMVSGRGIGLMINLLYGGTNPSFTSPLLQGLSVGHIGLVPTRLILGAAIFGALWLLIRRTALGLFLEAVGGNSKAANLAGIDARLVKYAAYLICGLCAAWAGVVLAADTHTSDPVSIGLYIELDAILAVVIGGGSLSGGRIYLGMTVLGALVIQALTTSILTSGLPPEYNLVVKAVVVVDRPPLAIEQHASGPGPGVRGRKAMRAINEKYLPLLATIAVFAALFITGGLLYNNFMSTLVLGDVLADNAFIITAAIGTTFVILSGGIDLSIGSMIGFVGVAMANLDVVGWHPLASAALMLGFGLIVRRSPGVHHRLLRDPAVHRHACRAFPAARRLFHDQPRLGADQAPVCRRLRRGQHPSARRRIPREFRDRHVGCAGGGDRHRPFHPLRRQCLRDRRRPRLGGADGRADAPDDRRHLRAGRRL